MMVSTKGLPPWIFYLQGDEAEVEEKGKKK